MWVIIEADAARRSACERLPIFDPRVAPCAPSISPVRNRITSVESALRAPDNRPPRLPSRTQPVAPSFYEFLCMVVTTHVSDLAKQKSKCHCKLSLSRPHRRQPRTHPSAPARVYSPARTADSTASRRPRKAATMPCARSAAKTRSGPQHTVLLPCLETQAGAATLRRPPSSPPAHVQETQHRMAAGVHRRAAS